MYAAMNDERPLPGHVSTATQMLYRSSGLGVWGAGLSAAFYADFLPCTGVEIAAGGSVGAFHYAEWDGDRAARHQGIDQFHIGSL